MIWQTRVGLVKKHSSSTLRRLEADIFPWVKERCIADITAPELLRLLRRIEERGAIETAHRVLHVCGQIFRYAIATGRASSNPAADLRGALPPVKATHLAATTEPRKLALLLNDMDGYVGSLPVKCALQLAPLVFVRPGELRHAQWADIDLETAEWRFTVSKTGTPHIVPLS
jgi:integrase